MSAETIISPVQFQKRREFVTPAALRLLIKQNLGYNSKQVTVSGGSRITWLTITIRDAAVDVKKVEEFAKTFDTMVCHMDDSYDGQSVNVKTTGEVDLIHGAPHVHEILEAVEKAKGGLCSVKLSNGKILRSSTQGYWVQDDSTGKRGCYTWSYDVEHGTGWAIQSLAKQMARV